MENTGSPGALRSAFGGEYFQWRDFTASSRVQLY